MKLYEITHPFGFDPQHVKQVANQVLQTHPMCRLQTGDLFGLCAVLTYTFWHALGKPKEFRPYSVMTGEEEHVLLFSPKQQIALDITGNQFNQPLINLNPHGVYRDFVRLSNKQIEDLKHS